MSYVDSTLAGNEKVLYPGRISLWLYWQYFFLALVFLVVAISYNSFVWIGGSIILLIPPMLGYATSELAITSRRVVSKFGLISRTTFEVNLLKVENIEVRQSALGRILDYGEVLVGSAGGSRSIPSVKSPLEFAKQVMRIQKNTFY